MTEFEDGGWPTIAELASRLDPKGELAKITNILEKKNPILRDMPWQEGNLPTGHEITLTSESMPTPSFRQLNRGVTPTKAKTEKYVESCALLEDHSIVDEMGMALKGGAEWRFSEDMLKMQGMNEYFATELMYESVASNPERFHGLAPRYPATTGYDNSDYVKVGTNSGVDCRSVWLLTWEPRKLYGIYPQGVPVGIQKEDMGRQRVTDVNSKPYYAYETVLRWWCGLAVEDYRYAVRFQWDDDDPEMATGERGLIEGILDMQDMLYEITPMTRYYMDRTTVRRMKTQMRSNESNLLQVLIDPSKKMPGDPETMGGERIRTLDGIPMRVIDALTAETAIS